MFTDTMNADTRNIDPRIAQAVTRWHISHARRQELLTWRSYRPCLGIAALVHDFDRHAIAVDDRTFLPNHALRWMAVRDLPPGLTPLSPAIHRRGATFVDTATATLRYGMPVIDLAANSRDTRDLKRQPVPAHKASSVRPDMFALPTDLRHFELAVAISEHMTDFAEHHRIRYQVPAPAPLFPRPYFRLGSLLANTSKVNYLLNRQGILCARGSIFLAAWASGRLRIGTTISQLWWDVTHLADQLDADLEAFILPPIPLPHWSNSHRQIVGETAVVVQTPTLPRTDRPASFRKLRHQQPSGRHAAAA